MSENTDSERVEEWSHTLLSEDVDQKPIVIDLSAPEECFKLLSKRLNLHSIIKLDAKIKLARNSVTKVIHIDGKMDAVVFQRCVITTEPVEERVKDDFEAWFSEPNNAVSFTKAKRERMKPQEQEDQPMIEEYDEPEEIENGKIDLGELVTQYLSLSLNPYPRADGAEHDVKSSSLTHEDEIYDNPFAALKDWKMSEKKSDG